MKYEEIIKLLDAGYTREEILEMDKPDPENKKDPDLKNKKDPAQEDKKDPAQEDKKDPAPDMAGMMDEMKKMFSDLTKELVASNIMRSRIDGEDDNEDIIAKIINPKIDKNGGK